MNVLNFENVWQLTDNTVFVRGSVRGAIYNFSDSKVYSVNEDACKILENYIKKPSISHSFLENLENTKLLDKNYIPKKYEFAKIENKPEFVWLEITGKCNLKCIHCYDGDKHYHNEDDLTFTEWINILDELKKIGCKTVEFIGGEPCCNQDLYKLMGYAKNVGLRIELYTNLTLITDEIFNFICENAITVHFSLYGSTSDSHDRITTVEGSFNKTMEMLRKLKEKNVKLIPSATFMKQNEKEIEPLKKLMTSYNLKLKVDSIRPSKFRDISNLVSNEVLNSNILIKKPNFVASKCYFEKAASVNTCLFGKFSITPEGNIIPCEFAREYIIGNVRESSLQEIINSEKLRAFWYMDFSKIENCKDCEYRFACKDCRFLSDDLYKKKSRCLYQPFEGKW